MKPYTPPAPLVSNAWIRLRPTLRVFAARQIRADLERALDGIAQPWPWSAGLSALLDQTLQLEEGDGAR